MLCRPNHGKNWTAPYQQPVEQKSVCRLAAKRFLSVVGQPSSELSFAGMRAYFTYIKTPRIAEKTTMVNGSGRLSIRSLSQITRNVSDTLMAIVLSMPRLYFYNKVEWMVMLDGEVLFLWSLGRIARYRRAMMVTPEIVMKH